MDKEAIKVLKKDYNFLLKRYYNGCKYLENNREEIDKWMPELGNIMKSMDVLLDEIMKYEEIKEEQILKGF